jgi:adenylyl-sulfate kinase
MEGFVVWFTGLPSAGKSTLAGLLGTALRGQGVIVEVLDGDEIRKCLARGLGFSKEDRDENIRRIAFVARLLARQGTAAITAAIAPYRESREEAKRSIGRFVEVYVKCPLEVCIQRDVKGHYRRALAGELPHFTGISDPYEEPLHPDVVVETDRESAESGVAKVLQKLEQHGYLQRDVTYVLMPSSLLREAEQRVGPGSTVAGHLAELLRRDLKESP